MATVPLFRAPELTRDPLAGIMWDCDEVGRTPRGDTHKIASLFQDMSLKYYQDVRKQAQQSFFCALVAAIIGTGFFFYSAYLLMQTAGRANATLSLIAGALVQVISGINFFLYSRASRQFALFHVCLERVNRYMIANSLCDNVTSEQARDALRETLSTIMVKAPMLTLDGEPDRASVETRTARRRSSPRNRSAVPASSSG
jgi:hypothetical protein